MGHIAWTSLLTNLDHHVVQPVVYLHTIGTIQNDSGGRVSIFGGE